MGNTPKAVTEEAKANRERFRLQMLAQLRKKNRRTLQMQKVMIALLMIRPGYMTEQGLYTTTVNRWNPLNLVFAFLVAITIGLISAFGALLGTLNNMYFRKQKHQTTPPTGQ